MKESDFIEQNKEKWHEFENNLLGKNKDPLSIGRLFVQITDDLSYARTFYRNRSVRVYLNSIASILFNNINRAHAKKFEGFRAFWTTELPLTIYHARRAMLISLLVFVSCFALGVITSMHDKDFAAQVLSMRYVSMTEENISKGDPMAVYKTESEIRTFLPILVNNLRVDLLTFFAGVIMSVGSLVVMVANGVMVGVFQYFFIERGVFWESFLGIWTHGSLEIPTIILSGGAGLTLGKGLLFPGTYTRLQAFKISGMNGLRIILGVAPLTLLAAFVEGFVTRHTGIPDFLRLLFILAAFASVVAYFVVYPKKVAKRMAYAAPALNGELLFRKKPAFEPDTIYTPGRIITESFRILGNNALWFLRSIILVSIGAAILVAWNPQYLFRRGDDIVFSAGSVFNYDQYPATGVLTALLFAFQCFYGLRLLSKRMRPEMPHLSINSGPALVAMLAGIIYVLIIYSGMDLSIYIAQAIVPVLVFICSVSYNQGLGVVPATGNAFDLIRESPSRFIFSALGAVVLSGVIYLASNFGLNIILLNEALIWVLTADDIMAAKITAGFKAFQSFLSLFFYLSLSLVCATVCYFSLVEALTAKHLRAKIAEITTKK